MLPLTAFFPRVDKPRNRRRVNAASGSGTQPAKRRGANLQPDSGAKRRKEHERGRDDNGRPLQPPVARTQREYLHSSNPTAPKKLLLQPEPICDPIEISDDEGHPTTVHERGRKGKRDSTDTPAASAARRDTTTTPQPDQLFAAPCSCSSNPPNTSTGQGYFQRPDTDFQGHRLLVEHNEKTDVLGMTVVPSSQSTGYQVPSTPRSEVRAPAVSPTLKSPHIPVTLHLGSNSPVTPMSSPAKESYIPSSQTQSMIIFDTSPCRHRISATVVASPLRRHRPFTSDGVVQSSQSQIEKDIRLAAVLSPVRLPFTDEVDTPASLLHSTPNNMNPNPITHVMETHEVPLTLNSDSPLQRSSVIYTSPIRCPSEIAAALDSDEEGISCSPTSLQQFHGGFDKDEVGLSSQENHMNLYHRSASTYPPAEDMDSATESDTDDDMPANVTLRESNRADSEYFRGYSAESRPLSAPYHESYESETSGISFSDSLDMEYATSPVFIPEDLTFNSDSMTSDDESLRSLPSPVKRFREIFTEGDSWADGFPSSPEQEDQGQR